MPIDSSIYSNIQTPQSTMQNPLDVAAKGMQLSQLGMQQAQMQREMQNQMMVRQAYMNNTDQNGQVNRQGVLSDLGKVNPMLAQSIGSGFVAQDKAKAEAQAQQADAAQKGLTLAVPAVKALQNMSEEQRAAAYPAYIKNLKDNGVNTQQWPDQYDPDHFKAAAKMTLDSIPAATQLLQNYHTQAQTAEAYANTAKIKSETPTGIIGQVTPHTDPATLVTQVVPKDARPKALEEIKNAQDINALTPKIMAAFDMASSRNPNTAAQGRKQFEGLINTTVKETEGTARQAAFDSIHKTMTPSGLLALPGENDAKRNTVISYLQSKASAPTNKAYGIDLSKFASTGEYQEPAKKDQTSVGATNAVAASPPDYNKAKEYLKTADPSDPKAFKIRQILKSKGMLQ